MSPLIRGIVAAGVTVILALFLATPSDMFGSMSVFLLTLGGVAFLVAFVEIPLWIYALAAVMLVAFSKTALAQLGFSTNDIGFAIAIGGAVQVIAHWLFGSSMKPARSTGARGN